jgi:excisionase family DNA binding protein
VSVASDVNRVEDGSVGAAAQTSGVAKPDSGNAARARPLEPVPRLGLRPQEAAEALGVSRDTFDALVADGRVRVVRVGRRVVIPVRELELERIMAFLRRGDAPALDAARRLTRRLVRRVQLNGPPSAKELRARRSGDRRAARFWKQHRCSCSACQAHANPEAPVSAPATTETVEPLPDNVRVLPTAYQRWLEGGGTGSKPSGGREWTSQRKRASRSASAGLEDWNP